MKSLTELKRAIKVGTRLEVIDHWKPELIGQIRTVTKTQGNGYWHTIPGDARRMWGDYAPAANTSFPAPDVFRVSFRLGDTPEKFWEIRVHPPVSAL